MAPQTIFGRLPQLAARNTRTFTSSVSRPAFATGPSPPRLPPKEQEEFERLQKLSTGAFSTPATPSTPTRPDETPRVTPKINQSPGSNPSRPQINQSPTTTTTIDASGKGQELHPDVRRGAKPEFEGEKNPKTGEVGGPKNEPLRWGGSGDWSYNGRVTDF